MHCLYRTFNLHFFCIYGIQIVYGKKFTLQVNMNFMDVVENVYASTPCQQRHSQLDNWGGGGGGGGGSIFMYVCCALLISFEIDCF
jgi:hypothetical protein